MSIEYFKSATVIKGHTVKLVSLGNRMNSPIKVYIDGHAHVTTFLSTARANKYIADFIASYDVERDRPVELATGQESYGETYND
jgi:hypothetical protein